VAKAIVVDNGSVDGSADALEAAAPPGLALDLVRTGRNLGFGRGCNLGAGRGEAEFILLLNPDAALCPGTLREALAFMASPAAREVAACGIRLLDERGEIQRHCARFPSARTFLLAATGLPALLPARFAGLHDLAFDHRTSRDVDHVIGAFYLVRREDFEAVQGFDEDFFVYLEDLDLSRRLRLAGKRVRYHAEAVAFHKGGGTSEQVKDRRLFYALESRLVYAVKHFGPLRAAAVALATLLVEPVPRLARAAMNRSPGDAANTLRAFAWLWRAVAAAPRRFIGGRAMRRGPEV
jgi:N-acetylglucosaminyl-diphospho-decaprenol L-rhamnosyltransferase